MCYFVFALTVFFSTYAHSWNLDEMQFLERCDKEAPDWLRMQIAKDLQPFVEGIRAAQIEKTIKILLEQPKVELLQLVRIKILQNTVEVFPVSPLSTVSEERLENLREALEILNRLTKLPKLDFLLSLADAFDRPYFITLSIAPIFTVCKSIHNEKAIIFPEAFWNPNREALFQKIKIAANEIPLEKRKQIAFWRGSMSDGEYLMYEWDFKPRPRLIFQSRSFPELIDAAFVINEKINNIHPLWQRWLKDNCFFTPFVPAEEQMQYRYLIAIDSYGSPKSLEWQLFSGSVVLKQNTKKRSWYDDGLLPYVHYVPFRSDSIDLTNQIVWLKENEAKELEIAYNAKVFAEERLSDEMAFLYMYKLFISYAALNFAQ